jgi:hypothetical protein
MLFLHLPNALEATSIRPSSLADVGVFGSKHSESRLGDEWVSIRREQPDALAFPLNGQRVAVVFDFVNPVAPGRDVWCRVSAG